MRQQALRLVLLCAAMLLLDMPDAPARAASPAPPVLLTFDVEAHEDVAALRSLALAVPATYFITGRFAEDHPDVVRALATQPGNTIGSHSYDHANLTQLDPDAMRKDLLLSKLLLRDAAGTAPRWFRAPFLEVNERVAEAIKAAGFTHDSSNRERWMMESPAVELPVSSGPGLLASDYDLFIARGMTDEAALAWLLARYEERAALGRPLVLLLHPRIIAAHAAVLVQLIAQATQRGAVFLGADDYMKRIEQRSASSLGAWINLSGGPHEAAQAAADLQQAGIAEIFLMAKDPEGNRHYAQADAPAGGPDDTFGRMIDRLKAAGIRVHAWLPVFSDPVVAQRRPALAMVGRSGARSPDWLSPSSPEVRVLVADIVRDLLAKYPIDGIHLDYLRYPDLEHDFGAAAIQRFGSWSGLDPVPVQQLLSDHYSRWTDWRTEEIAGFVAAIRAEIRRATDRNVILSAALIGDAALNYRSREKYGQDYAALAAQLDWVIPMAYFHEDLRPVEWIGHVIRAARFHVGDRPLLAGIEAYQKPGAWTFDRALFERSISQARVGTDGIAFFPYLHLFARSGDGRDMPPGSADALAALHARPSGSTGR